MKSKGLIIGIACLLCAAVSDAKEIKLALFPFEAKSSADFSEVQAGIAAMLPGRISMPGQILVIEPAKEEPDRKQPALSSAEQLALAKKAGADYLLRGSITKMGNTISIDGRLVSTAGGNPIPLSAQSEGIDGVIQQLNILADKTRDSILKTPAPQKGPDKAAAPAAKNEPQPARRGSQAYRQPDEEPDDTNAPSASRQPGKSRRLEADMPRQNAGANKSPLFDTSSRVTATLRGKPLNYLCSGDVNNDGKRELIAAGIDCIKICQFSGATLTEIADIPVRSDEQIVHVDAGDFNGNGIDEIYVSCFDKQNARSFVVEFQQGRFVRILENQKLFYRAYSLSDGSIKLVGQEAATTQPFSGGLYLLQWKDGKLISREKFVIPGNQGIYAFGEGDIDGDGTTDFLSYDKGLFKPEPQLIIASAKANAVWRDTSALGGTPNSFNKSGSGNDIDEEEKVPLRIICAQLTKNRRWAVITGKNFRKDGGAVAAKFLGYNRGEVECLLWDGSDLSPVWTSSPVSDAVHDYLLDDIDKDDVKELIILSSRLEGLLGACVNTFEKYKMTNK